MEAKGFAGLITFRARTGDETRVYAPHENRQCLTSGLRRPVHGTI